MEIKINLLVARKDSQSGISYIFRTQGANGNRTIEISDIGRGIGRRRLAEADFLEQYREATIDEVADFYSQMQSIFESIMEPMKDAILLRQGDDYKISQITKAVKESKDSRSLISSIRDIVLTEESICIKDLERIGHVRDSIMSVVDHDSFTEATIDSADNIGMLRETVSDAERNIANWLDESTPFEEMSRPRARRNSLNIISEE